MALRHSRDVADFLRQYGVTPSGDAAKAQPLADELQAVVVVEDATDLAPELRFPRGAAGGVSGAAIGVRSAVEVFSLADGGIVVEGIHNDGNAYFLFVSAVDLLTAGITALTVRTLGSQAPVSTAREGTGLDASFPPLPDGILIPANSIIQGVHWYVPRGSRFYVCAQIANLQVQAAVFWRELLRPLSPFP